MMPIRPRNQIPEVRLRQHQRLSSWGRNYDRDRDHDRQPRPRPRSGPRLTTMTFFAYDMICCESANLPSISRMRDYAILRQFCDGTIRHCAFHSNRTALHWKMSRTELMRRGKGRSIGCCLSRLFLWSLFSPASLFLLFSQFPRQTFSIVPLRSLSTSHMQDGLGRSSG